MDGNRNMSEKFMKDFNGSKVFSLEYDKETLKDMVLEKQEEIERLNKELDIAIDICNKRQVEIVRLNNIIHNLRADYGTKAQVERDLLEIENKRLHSVIKEAREYTNDLLKLKENDYFDLVDKSYIKRYLEILDKVEEKDND